MQHSPECAGTVVVLIKDKNPPLGNNMLWLFRKIEILFLKISHLISPNINLTLKQANLESF